MNEIFYANRFFSFLFPPPQSLIFSLLFIQITVWKEYMQVIISCSLWLEKILSSLAAYGTWLLVQLLDMQQQ